VLLLACSWFLLYVFTRTGWFFGRIISSLSLIIAIIELIRYVEKTNKELTRFLASLRYDDYTSSHNLKAEGETFMHLGKSFDNVINDFRKLRIEQEAHFQYLRMIHQHVDVALVCFRESGEVDLFNKAAANLFKTTFLHRITDLEKIDNEIYILAKSIRSGEKRLLITELRGVKTQLAVRASEFRLLEKGYKLVSFQDIGRELSENENVAWQKLIRVLTHEIMNSVTPITSLAHAVNSLIGENGGEKDLKSLDPQEEKDLRDSLKTIESRSKGLMNFITSYKNYAQVPVPKIRETDLHEIFSHLIVLLRPEIEKVGVKLKLNLTETQIKADPELLQQVFLNLLLNAIEAVRSSEIKNITVEAVKIEAEKVKISISDSGAGISDELKEKIFIPFFTTKKQGSGIGLSLSRQIINAHKGEIYLESGQAGGAKFTIEI
jgi:two-component system, NtrC family, nitrogen regulation sensor histidine kinase NtrY